MKELEIQFVQKQSKQLEEKTVFLTGNSKSIGRAIALRLAQDGANVVLASDIDLSDIANEVKAVGGNVLAVKMNFRDEANVKEGVDKAAKHFGGIDILINNTSMVTNNDTEETTMQEFDDVIAINVRATFLVIKMCLPYLKEGSDPHILNISPPLNLHRRWFAGRVAYTLAKYGMSMCILAMAQEFKGYGIMVNCLWPRFVIENEIEAKAKSKDVCRKAEIMGDAALSILVKDPKSTGLFYFDDQALKEDGVTDFKKYCVNPSFELQLILTPFVDDSGVVYEKADVTTKTMKLEKPEVAARFPEILERIQSLIDEALTKKVNALYKFTVNGSEAKTATLDLRSGAGKFHLGEPGEKEDTHIIMEDDAFYDVFVQGIKMMFIVRNGRCKFEGDGTKMAEGPSIGVANEKQPVLFTPTFRLLQCRLPQGIYLFKIEKDHDMHLHQKTYKKQYGLVIKQVYSLYTKIRRINMKFIFYTLWGEAKFSTNFSHKIINKDFC